MARARAKARPVKADPQQDSNCLHGWLSPEELATLPAPDKWRLMAERQEAALVRLARESRVTVEEARRRLSAAEPPGPRLRDRAEALRQAEALHEPCGSERRDLVRARKRALAGAAS
jgi:hypothetical protein